MKVLIVSETGDGLGIAHKLVRENHSVRVYIQDKKYNWYRDWETDRKSTRLNSSHSAKSRMPSSA